MAHDLQREVFKAVLKKTAIEGKEIDYVIAGTVIQEVLTSNIAREAGMGAGLPLSTPGHTVTLACISSNVAAMTATAMIKAGMIETALVGGVEYMSDIPIKFQRPLRKRMLKATKMKSPGQYLSLLNGLSLGDLAPQAPAVAEFSTGEVMGYSADKLASKFGVTRAEQDEFALRSHQLAARAQEAGLFADEIMPTKNSKGAYVLKDNGVRGDSTIEKLASLKPAFIKPHGTITAANASFLTDGASAAILMSEEKCLALGYVPRSIMAHTVFSSQDPKEELLLGPAYAISKVLAKAGLTMRDIGVFEMHEAFAGQVLANFKALDSDKFCREALGRGERVGLPDMSIINARGGSLSIGHPFGATGTRLLKCATERLRAEDKSFALIAACAAGGQAVAHIIERHKAY